MERWTMFPALLMFTLACNLDTLLLSVGYAARGVALSAGGRLAIAALTTAVTWLSLALGDLTALILAPRLSQALGALVLVGIGLWFLLDWLRRSGKAEEEPPAGERPGGRGSYVALAAALAVNNAGAGVAAGAGGMSPLGAAGCNFAVTLLFLAAGGKLGRGGVGRLLGRYALPLSGALLVALGCWELFL